MAAFSGPRTACRGKAATGTGQRRLLAGVMRDQRETMMRQAMRLGTGCGVAALLALGGCAPMGNCDPTQTTFISGIACSAGGGYQQRQEQLSNEGAIARGRAAQAQQDAAAAERQAEAMRAGARAAEQRVRQQDAELARMRRQLQELRAQRGTAMDAAQRDRMRQAEADLREAERRRAAAATDPAEAERREQAMRRARQNIDELIGF